MRVIVYEEWCPDTNFLLASWLKERGVESSQVDNLWPHSTKLWEALQQAAKPGHVLLLRSWTTPGLTLLQFAAMLVALQTQGGAVALADKELPPGLPGAQQLAEQAIWGNALCRMGQVPPEVVDWPVVELIGILDAIQEIEAAPIGVTCPALTAAIQDSLKERAHIAASN